MTVGTLFVIIVLIVIAIMLLFVFVAKMVNSDGELSRAQKKELKESRILIKQIEVLARQNKDVYPEFWQVIDVIDQSTYKELNS